LEAAGKIEPGNPRVWAALAQTYFKLHETGKADDAAAKAFELAPRDPIILRGLAIYYSEAGQILKAADMQAGYTAASPQDRQAIFQAIDLYLKAGQPERAITTTKQVQNWETRADLRHTLAKL